MSDQPRAVPELDSSQPLTRELIATPAGVFTLGLICARLLQQHGESHLHLSLEGLVEVIPMGEAELDVLPEQEALQRLVANNYTDQQLESYLKGREARLQRRGGL